MEFKRIPLGSPPDRPYTLLYDGDCAVCLKVVEQLRRWDTGRQIAFLPSQDPAVAERFPAIPAADLGASMQLVAKGGERWQAGAAVEQILAILPRGRVAGPLFRIPLVRPLVDWGYRLFARNRHRFGCGTHCAVGR